MAGPRLTQKSGEADIQENLYNNVTVNPEVLATVEYIVENLSSSRIILLDFRTPADFYGIIVRAKRGGHTLGSVNVEWRRAFERP
ncbi:hypothetical protein KEJ39_02580 [Candidatus Bathyarchaeota archaeon]|nr:hypothetical protein [Candidatus Bathyarchaeota archaeon]